MTILDDSGLLVLGAGVSEPFGFPLGGQLIDQVADQASRELSATRETPDSRPSVRRISDYLGTAKAWYSAPLLVSLIRYFESIQPGERLSHIHSATSALTELHGLLMNQTAETIDAFIAENPKIAPAAKVAIACMMIRSVYTPDKRDPTQLVCKPLDRRILDVSHRNRPGDTRIHHTQERNWVHLLINIVRNGIDDRRLTQDRRIPIVTFNYDTALEFILERQFANRENALGSYENFFDIVHVHGKFGKMHEILKEPWTTSLEWARGISVVKEHSPLPQVLAAQEKAKALIESHHRIYVAGFSFAGPNCRVLGLLNRPGNLGGIRVLVTPP